MLFAPRHVVPHGRLVADAARVEPDELGGRACSHVYIEAMEWIEALGEETKVGEHLVFAHDTCISLASFAAPAPGPPAASTLICCSYCC